MEYIEYINMGSIKYINDIDESGNINIPTDLRKELGIKPFDDYEIKITKNGYIVLKKWPNNTDSANISNNNTCRSLEEIALDLLIDWQLKSIDAVILSTKNEDEKMEETKKIGIKAGNILHEISKASKK